MSRFGVLALNLGKAKFGWVWVRSVIAAESIDLFDFLPLFFTSQEFNMFPIGKRLQKEAAALKDNADESIFLRPTEGNIAEWLATINGPYDSYYEGYEFDLAISVPSSYPIDPPRIRFLTKVFHPNVMFEVNSSMTRFVPVLKKSGFV